MQEEGFKEWMAPEALLYYYIKHTSKHVPFDDDDAAAASLMMSLIRSEEMTTTMKTRFSLKGKNKKQKPTNT